MNKSRESAYFRNRRRNRERILTRVGVGTETGQRLLDRWWREDTASRPGAKGEGNDSTE